MSTQFTFKRFLFDTRTLLSKDCVVIKNEDVDIDGIDISVSVRSNVLPATDYVIKVEEDNVYLYWELDDVRYPLYDIIHNDDPSYLEVTYVQEVSTKIDVNTESSSSEDVDELHDIHKFDAIQSTCTEDGNLEYYECSVCGLKYKTSELRESFGFEEEITRATGHSELDPVTENSVDPQCTVEGGYDTVIYCGNCGCELSRVHTVIPPTGHTEVTTYEDQVDPTCVDQGSVTKVVTCSVCLDELSRDTIIYPPKGHVESEPVKEHEVAPTCTQPGHYENAVYCEVCEQELDRDTVEIPPTGHSESSPHVENKVNSTCIVAGHYDSVIYCNVCSVELSRTLVPLPLIDHNSDKMAIRIITPPTCTVDGIASVDKICSMCNRIMSSYEQPISATGHTKSTAVRENIVNATCTVDGHYDSVVYCSVCNAQISRTVVTIPKTGHTSSDAVRENVVNSTCTTAGHYDSVVYCSVCHAQISRTVVSIPATGHNWGSWTTVTAPTYSVTGTKKRVCSNDSSHVETGTIAVKESRTLPSMSLACCWDTTVTSENANVRYMNDLSYKLSDSSFTSRLNKVAGYGCNTVHWFICNQGDDSAHEDTAGYSIYGSGTPTPGSYSTSFVNNMKARCQQALDKGLHVVLWLLADDSAGWNGVLLNQPAKYAQDIYNSGLLAYASEVVLGLEINEYASTSQISALSTAIQAYWPKSKIGIHHGNGSSLQNYKTYATNLYFQETGSSASDVAAHIKTLHDNCLSTNKINGFELKWVPATSYCNSVKSELLRRDANYLTWFSGFGCWG